MLDIRSLALEANRNEVAITQFRLLSGLLIFVTYVS